MNRKLVSVKKELADAKVENESLRWFRGNVDEKVEALEAEVSFSAPDGGGVGSANKTKAAQSVDAAFSEHW